MVAHNKATLFAFFKTTLCFNFDHPVDSESIRNPSTNKYTLLDYWDSRDFKIDRYWIILNVFNFIKYFFMNLFVTLNIIQLKDV